MTRTYRHCPFRNPFDGFPCNVSPTPDATWTRRHLHHDGELCYGTYHPLQVPRDLRKRWRRGNAIALARGDDIELAPNRPCRCGCKTTRPDGWERAAAGSRGSVVTGDDEGDFGADSEDSGVFPSRARNTAPLPRRN